MARTLDTPVVRPDVVQQAVTGIRFEIPHIRNIANTAMEIQKAQVQIWYEVTTYNEDGDPLYTRQRTLKFPNWTAGFITDMKAVYAKVEIDATNQGLIYGPGTDEPLE